MAMAETQMNENDIREEAFKLCREFLGSPWNEIGLSDFKFAEMGGGLSSILYRCSLGNNVKLQNKKTARQVLLRFYGPMQDAEHIIVLEAIIFVILAEKNLGPRLMGLFPNGRLEEFIPSKSLHTDDIRPLSATIARTMAKIHALNVPVSKVPDQIPYHMKKWLKEVEKDTRRVTKEGFSLGDIFRNEVSWITKEMEKSTSPIVFCHNDLQGGNILLREDSANKMEPNLMFIDFEFGAYNYRSFDIANHFCEWTYDYNTPDPPYFTLSINKYPSKEEKIEFIRTYLHQLVQEDVMDVSDVESETEKILDELELFGMAAHLYWAIWCEKMKFESDKSPFYAEHGKTRRTLYWKAKENYMRNTAQQNGINSSDKMNGDL
ncbi:choline/ethanolamine kinase [Parasteatoda tepidariorum]|uniref:choline/ethanolamine kinase n=1 Tax=Parasteatoda tepidariorum TaxID=114398 RepID=UPI00077F973F|nr:choline/ethanolamine kinase [Parasteatoda tepidariorum]